MSRIKMKVIGREKRKIGYDEYSDFYLVQFPEIDDNLETTYFGNGERGGLYSFVPLFQRYGEEGWKSENLEDLRNENVPVPKNIEKQILQLLKSKEERLR